MREFKLQNAIGQQWNLTVQDSFLSAPKGLGVERKTTYEQIGNKWIGTEDMQKQKSITGKAVFESYEKFHDFCMFAQHRPLTLIYTSAGTYRIQVSLEKIGKTEMEAIGISSDITMKGLTAWYKIINVEDTEAGYGKKYPYIYDYTYADNAIGNLEFNTDSVAESPVKLVIIGPCLNPSWIQYENGILKATGRVSCVVGEGNRLIVDTTKIPYEIAECSQSGEKVRDLYQDSDFSTQRFLFAGYGHTKISVTHEGSAEIHAAAEVMIEYEAV